MGLHPVYRAHSPGLGAILGAGLMVTTFVLGVVTIVEEFQVHRRPFLRDVSFYLFTVIFLFITFLDGKVCEVVVFFLLCLPERAVLS